MLIDTHSHLFLEEFSDDLPQVMERARQAGVSRIYMPNMKPPNSSNRAASSAFPVKL